MIQKKRLFRIIFFILVFPLAAAFVYGFLIEPEETQIHYVRIKDPLLAKPLGGKVIAHLSDLHIQSFGSREKRLLKTLDELKPDIIFLTGDYVKWRGDYEPALLFLSNLKAKIGVWAVMGDYDYSDSRKSCLFCHEEGKATPTKRHNVVFLRDNIHKLKLPGGSVNIAGIDIEKRWPLDSDLQSRLEREGAPSIILSHSPLAFEHININGLLMLAGDTHGGQIALPSWLFSLLGYRKNALYNQGLFEKNGAKMFVNRGIGTSHLPMRLFRKPEVAVLIFEP